MKIAFIGGGSVQWTAKLVADMALTPALNGAELVLHDIDADALTLLTRVCEKIMQETGSQIQIKSTLDRREALRGAKFVILCVAIGRLEAMRYDLEIPLKYGIHQAVGDTVGAGGLARGLRHIPFALQVAHEMESLCPAAWMLNLTNPMTTITRAVNRASGIPCIGLCHEVSGVRRRFAEILNLPHTEISFSVLGINHLPLLLNPTIAGRDGKTVLREWINENGLFSLTDERLNTIRDIFHDRLAVKLTLLENLDILFGAGDRHVAEFFAGFLNESAQLGGKYGVILTTINHRAELMAQRRTVLEAYVAGTAPQTWTLSDEQLAPVMAALSGGTAGEFVINIPNRGQINNLPNDVVVECSASVDRRGVHPLALGAIPAAAHAVIAGHVARQELIVESALTGKREPALAALATDPLVTDPSSVGQMLDEMLEANAQFLKE
jgi:alpha-galactosidase